MSHGPSQLHPCVHPCVQCTQSVENCNCRSMRFAVLNATLFLAVFRSTCPEPGSTDVQSLMKCLIVNHPAVARASTFCMTSCQPNGCSSLGYQDLPYLDQKCLTKAQFDYAWRALQVLGGCVPLFCKVCTGEMSALMQLHSHLMQLISHMHAHNDQAYSCRFIQSQACSSAATKGYSVS
jgi:hypothetical protein